MSGIEIAGLVLGGFPILLSALQYYRECFEPLEAWWGFQTQFIAFVDDINHQMMLYTENLTRLLDPLIADGNDLKQLIRDTADPRWKDKSLDEALRSRLDTEHARYIRIVDRMQEVIVDFKGMLRIRDGVGNTSWVDQQSRSWEFHLTRFQVSFSKGKQKKVKKLAKYNQELQEILGYSERIIPIAESRKTSDPVSLLEKVRQQACGVYHALKPHWKCACRQKDAHQVHLRLKPYSNEIIHTGLEFLFTLESDAPNPGTALKQQISVRAATGIINQATLPDQGIPIRSSALEKQLIESHVYRPLHAEDFVSAQDRFSAQQGKDKPRWSKLFTKSLAQMKQPTQSSTDAPTTKQKASRQTSFKCQPSSDATAKLTETCHESSSDQARKIGGSGPLPITDLCSALRGSGTDHKSLGLIRDEYGRTYEMIRPTPPGLLPETAELTTLAGLLDKSHATCLEVSRQKRFEIAASLARALLQLQASPWLSSDWSKHDFHFLIDSGSLYCQIPHVSRAFASVQISQPSPRSSVQETPLLSEEATRHSLFVLGVIILELIFGHSIEKCAFRSHYYGPGNKPNDQTDVSTARKWSLKVLGESGVEIADVVRRCLDCSFGPRPNFTDKRFREAVYTGVIQPLQDYLKTWQVVVP